MLDPLILLVRPEGFEPPTHGLEVLYHLFFVFADSKNPVKSRVLRISFFIFSIKIRDFFC